MAKFPAVAKEGGKKRELVGQKNVPFVLPAFPPPPLLLLETRMRLLESDPYFMDQWTS